MLSLCIAYVTLLISFIVDVVVVVVVVVVAAAAVVVDSSLRLSVSGYGGRSPGFKRRRNVTG